MAHEESDLLQAQESAGIFVDDAHLFEQPLSGQGRKLQQTDAVSCLKCFQIGIRRVGIACTANSMQARILAASHCRDT